MIAWLLGGLAGALILLVTIYLTLAPILDAK